MSSASSLIAVVCLYGFASAAIDHQRLSVIPRAVPRFDLDQMMGRWFIQGRLVSCNWQGSREFSNFETLNTRTKYGYKLKETWRNEDCVSVYSRLTEKNPGCFTAKDAIGNVWSGSMVIVAFVPKIMVIKYGCVKRSADGESCSDPWISVSTRRQFPNPKTYKIIEAALNQLFGLSLVDLLRIKHDNPCTVLSHNQKQPRFKLY